MLRTLLFGLMCSVLAESKVAFITGASSGIGYTTAKFLAQKGMKVVLTARREEKLAAAVDEIKAAGGEAMAVKLDVTKEQDHIDAIAAAESAFGGIDYYFINAGYEGEAGVPFVDQDLAETKKVMDINVVGMMASLKYGIKAIRKQKGGAMVSVSSIAGSLHGDTWAGEMDLSGFGPYCMSKAATDMMGRFSRTYERENIRVYNLKPAVYESEMVDRIGGTEGLSGFNPFFKGRGGDPIFLAEVVYNMFEGTTMWLPGQNVVADGDATFDADIFYKTLEVRGGNPSPSDIKPLLKNAAGGNYKCTTDSSCAIYNAKAEL